MKIGVCTQLDKLDLVEKLGYDYIEIEFEWLVSLKDEEFDF